MTAVEQLPEIITVDEAAELLRVNRDTLYNQIKEKRIPGAKNIGHVIRIHKPTLLEWLSGGNERVSRNTRRKTW